MELSEDDRTFLSTAVSLVASSLQNALLVERLRRQVQVLGEREESLGALSLRLMHAQEEERRRLALELHDEPLQQAIPLARRLRDGVQQDTRPLRTAVEEIIDALRAVCTNLYPTDLEDLGLSAGLEFLAEEDARAV